MRLRGGSNFDDDVIREGLLGGLFLFHSPSLGLLSPAHKGNLLSYSAPYAGHTRPVGHPSYRAEPCRLLRWMRGYPVSGGQLGPRGTPGIQRLDVLAFRICLHQGRFVSTTRPFLDPAPGSTGRHHPGRRLCSSARSRVRASGVPCPVAWPYTSESATHSTRRW